MTLKELQRANELDKEIVELETFIRTASEVWRGKLIQRETSFVFQSFAYGVYDKKEYTMDTKAKNEVLEILKVRLLRLKTELEDIGKEV